MKRCTIACDTAQGVRGCALTLPDDATIETALVAARAVLGAELVDWQQAGTGIYGRIRPRDHCWEDGDRIEVYRALLVDPRDRRRQQARRR